MAEKKPQDDSQREPQRPQKQDNKSTQKKVKGSVPANPAHRPIQRKQGKQPPIKASQRPVNRSNPIAAMLHATAQFLAGKFSPEAFAPMLARFYESFALYMQSPQAMTGQAQHALKNYLYGLETSVGSQDTAYDPRQNASLEQLKTQLSQIEAQYPYPQFMLGHYAHQTKAYIEAFQQRGTTTEPKNAASLGKDTTLELELDLAQVMITQDTTTQQGSTVLLGVLAHKQFEEALKKKLQAEALKKAEQEAAKTAVKLSLKWGARLVATVGMVLTPDQAHAPGMPLTIPKGYVLVKEGMFAGQLIKKLYISAAEAERVGKELQKMLQMTSAAPQSHLLANQLRHLIFAFRSRLPQGPIDPNKHRLEQYEDWGLEKMVDFLVKNYPRLNSHEKDRVRELLKANQAEKGLSRLAKTEKTQIQTVQGSVDKDFQKQRYWDLQTKKQQLERVGGQLSANEQAELDDLEEYFNILKNAHKHSITHQMYLRLKSLEKKIYPKEGITNLNDNDSVGYFGVYAIYINQQLIYKFGKANLSETNSVTNPYSQKIENIPVRIQLQLRRLRRAYPTLRITYQLIHKLGYVSTKRAKEIEDDYIFGHYYENKDVPEGNKDSFTPGYFRKYLQKKGSSDPHNYSKQ